MSLVKATAKWNDEQGEEQNRVIEVDYDFSDNVNAMIDDLGAEVVYRHAISSITVALQNQMRQWAQQGLTDDEIKNAGGKLDEWSPPSGKPRSANRLAKIEALMEKLTPEERELMLSKVGD